jgi:hypothetical protein
MANDNQMQDILAKLDEGVKSLFESDKYAEYLSVMSRFHNYSTRNTLLIFAQKPDAQRIAGYNSWKNNFNRQVKRGEHGIKILAPIPFNETKEFEKLDPDTKQPILDEHGQPVMETLMRMGARFKTVSVFDIGQTVGDPLPELAEPLTGDVARYELFMDALRAVSPLPIVFENLPPDVDGICRFGDKISIREGMSQTQTVAAVIHELAHAKFHDRQTLDLEGNPKSKRLEETEAESIAFVTAAKYGVETGANSFGYISLWQRDTEAKELQASLDIIRKSAGELIDAIDERYQALAKERGIDLSVVADELGEESNYNMIDGVINNAPPKQEPQPEPEPPQTDPIRERLIAVAQAETQDEKYDVAFAALVDALCADTGLLALADTGAEWQHGTGRAAIFDGGLYESIIGSYADELADILADSRSANRLKNTVLGEAYRRLDDIAYHRFVLDEYADATKSGRLETYEKPYPEDSGNDGMLVYLTERLPDGGVHDYSYIYGYDPGDGREHRLSDYLSNKMFSELRESVFGKPETTVTLTYKETEPVGSTVLRRLLFNDMNFNRELKRTRVEVLPPMGKYSVYAQHLSGVIGDDTTIHIGTDSSYLLPLNVDRTNFEKRYFESFIDRIFEKAGAQLDAALADPAKFANFQHAAITGRIDEAEAHNAVYKTIKTAKDGERRDNRVRRQVRSRHEPIFRQKQPIGTVRALRNRCASGHKGLVQQQARALRGNS